MRSERERETHGDTEGERGGDVFSLQAAAIAVPMRKQSTPWDRSPRIEAELETTMRLNDERVVLVFLRSVALRSAIPWDTVPPSMVLLSALRSH